MEEDGEAKEDEKEEVCNMQYASVITQFAGSFGKYVTSQCLASSRQVYWVIWSRDQLIAESLPSVV